METNEGAEFSVERGEPAVDAGVLRSKLINLTLDWELAVLTLDAQRYKCQTVLEREALRDNANIYRKCINEVTEIIYATTARHGKVKVG